MLLDVNNMLAPQAYLRISSIGINDPMGYVIGVILVLTSVAAVWVAKLALGGKDYSMLQKVVVVWSKEIFYLIKSFLLIL